MRSHGQPTIPPPPPSRPTRLVIHLRTRRARVAFVVGVTLVGGALGVLEYRLQPRRPRHPPAPRESRSPAVPPVGLPAAQLSDLGPRLITNDTSTPVLVTGHGLRAGDRLILGPPAKLEVALAEADGDHGWARLPAIDLPEAQSEADVAVTLKTAAGAEAQGQARLTIVNDRHFPDPIALAANAQGVCALSHTTAELVCQEAGGALARLSLGEGPSALLALAGQRGLLVGFEFRPELWVISQGEGALRVARKLPGPLGVTGLAVDGQAGVVYVAEHVHNQLWAIDLASGEVRFKTDLDPGPGRVALAGDTRAGNPAPLVAVGSKQTGEVQLVSAKNGKLLSTVAPTPGMPIVGGHTAPFSSRIMGGLAVRDLVYSRAHQLLFVASAGPNIGPNPERMEVAMNGGVTVIDLSEGAAAAKARYHLGFGAGCTESLALDDARGVLYASDVALGLVRALDVKALSAGPKGAERALLSTVAIAPPADFPRILPEGVLGVKGRASDSLHSGPKALALEGGALFAIDRFTGTLARFALSGHGQLQPPAQTALFRMLTEPVRREGEVLYYTDVGRTGMSCDTCHVDGHVGGLLFSKTKPIRLYRSTSVRGSRETPPYFIPASEQSLASTASFVGSRNRYQNPELSRPEIDALALFCSEIPTPPNPFVQADGSLPATLALPDGQSGHPLAGVQVFFGPGGCQGCHPAPLFTSDQSPTTRGRYLPVGTPALFPLHPEFQDPVAPNFPAQSLTGIWDLFPLTTTGSAGLGVRDDHLVVASRFPLRALLDQRGPIPHGHVAALSAEQENDLLAFLLTL